MPDTARRVGLIVNPVAGLGGPAGLKGSDLPNVLELTVGRERPSPRRAIEAMVELARSSNNLMVISAGQDMGEAAARAAELSVEAVPYPVGKQTTATDTRLAAKAIVASGAEVLMFVGGDGTAVDIFEAVGGAVPVLGIPSGVKMHSGVFAVSPRAAAAVLRAYLDSESPAVTMGEVLDVDEDLYRDGRIVPRLHGTLRVPSGPRLVQLPKGRTAIPDRVQVHMLAHAVRTMMKPDTTYVFGPGSTTAAVLESLGISGTLLGVDVVRNHELVASDVDDRVLERAITGDVMVVVSPIGGQGFVFGRGNQQISSGVLRRAGRAGVLIIAAEDKLVGLNGLPLRVDTGDSTVDNSIAGSGYIRVLTGPDAWMVYPIEAVP
jgi:predicted polyphosphate/ATP-dependent NAD kinase